MTGWRRAAAGCVSLVVCAGAAEAATKNFAAPSASVARSSGDRVNVRAGANLNYEVLTQLKAGEQILVTGHNGEWSQVRLPRSARCYVSAKFVERRASQGVPTADRINVRARPQATASILDQVHRSDTLTIIEETGGWYRIEPQSSWVGFVKSEYLQADPSLTVEQFLAANEPVVAAAPAGAAGAAAPGPAVATVPMAKPSSWTAKTRPLFVGELQRARGWFKPPASHRLVVDGRTTTYLTAEQFPLAQLEHQTVAIWGDPQTSDKWKAPLVHVTRLELVSATP